MHKQNKEAKVKLPSGRLIFFILLIGLILGILLIIYIQNCKPGTFCYSAKRALENSQLAFASSTEAKTLENLDQADERVKELVHVLSSQAEKREDPSEKTTVTVNNNTTSQGGTQQSGATTPAPTSTSKTQPENSDSETTIIGSSRQMYKSISQAESWGWISGNEQGRFVESLVAAIETLTSTIFGATSYTPDEVQEITVILVGEYNNNLELAIDNFHSINTAAKTEEEIENAREYAEIIAGKMLIHRGILERSLVFLDKNTREVLKETFKTIDKTEKVAFSVLPIDRQNQIVNKVKTLNPNVAEHVKQITSQIPRKNNKVIELDAGGNTITVTPDTSVPVDINVGHVGVEVAPVTTVDTSTEELIENTPIEIKVDTKLPDIKLGK